MATKLVIGKAGSSLQPMERTMIDVNFEDSSIHSDRIIVFVRT